MFSIGLNHGEYGGIKSNFHPLDSIYDLDALWKDALSIKRIEFVGKSRDLINCKNVSEL